jgi:hypothetical protein
VKVVPRSPDRTDGSAGARATAPPPATLQTLPATALALRSGDFRSRHDGWRLDDLGSAGVRNGGSGAAYRNASPCTEDHKAGAAVNRGRERAVAELDLVRPDLDDLVVSAALELEGDDRLSNLQGLRVGIDGDVGGDGLSAQVMIFADQVDRCCLVRGPSAQMSRRIEVLPSCVSESTCREVSTRQRARALNPTSDRSRRRCRFRLGRCVPSQRLAKGSLFRLVERRAHNRSADPLEVRQNLVRLTHATSSTRMIRARWLRRRDGSGT